MWWFVGIGGVVLYLIVLWTLGLSTLKNGHGWMFFFGFFFPLFWLIGAFMAPGVNTPAATDRRSQRKGHRRSDDVRSR